MVIPDHPVDPADQYRYSDSRDGLTLAIRPYHTKDESTKYFGMDFRETRLIALQVVAENHSHSKSFLLDKDQFAVATQTAKADMGLAERPGEHIQGVIAAAYFAPLGVAVFAPFAILSSNASASDAHMIKHNFAVNELQRHTLSPGDTVDGFIYIGLPKDTDVYPGTLLVTAKLKEFSTGKVVPFEFVLTLDAE